MKTNIVQLLFLILLLGLGACRNNPAAGHKTAGKAAVKFSIDQVDFMYLSARARISYQSGEQGLKSPVDIRMKKDSIIWISVRPVLGMEAARLLLTRDSVFVMDRLKRETRAFDFAGLSRQLQFEINFDIAQALILGNLPFDPNNHKNAAQQDDYWMINQVRDSIDITSYISRKNFKLTRLELSDPATQNKMSLTYDNFTAVAKQLLPYSSNAVVNYTLNNEPMRIEFGIEHSKVELLKTPLSFPF